MDITAQKKVMKERLAYYRRCFPVRSVEYTIFKSRFSIPRTRTALQRMKDGKYGICMKCDEKISEDRLVAVPAALLCIECQKEFEEGQR